MGRKRSYPAAFRQQMVALVRRDFSVDKPNKLWAADINYIKTGSGFLYLSVVIDAFSRRVVAGQWPHI